MTINNQKMICLAVELKIVVPPISNNTRFEIFCLFIKTKSGPSIVGSPFPRGRKKPPRRVKMPPPPPELRPFRGPDIRRSTEILTPESIEKTLGHFRWLSISYSAFVGILLDSGGF